MDQPGYVADDDRAYADHHDHHIAGTHRPPEV
jgi:hypothetical protein